MKPWELFEKECNEYLNQHFSNWAVFTLVGGSNSTVSDISVTTSKNKKFYIEAKHSPAQCGQFVLFPNVETNSFDYGSNNFVPINKYSQKIIDYMNKNFSLFKDVSSQGKSIQIKKGSKIFGKWIIETYKNKKVKFFITNEYTIIPLSKMMNYFNITAKYRIKKSGSSVLSNNCINKVKKYLIDNYVLKGISENNGRLFISSEHHLHNQRFVIDNVECMFSLRDGAYEVRRLSNTFNANVIFSIALKSNVKGLTLKEFIKYLKN